MTKDDDFASVREITLKDLTWDALDCYIEEHPEFVSVDKLLQKMLFEWTLNFWSSSHVKENDDGRD